MKATASCLIASCLALFGCASAPGSPVTAGSPVTTLVARPAGAALCDAFEVVNDVISPAFSSLAEGTHDEQQMAATMDAAAITIRALSREESDQEIAAEIDRMGELYADEADTIRREGIFGPSGEATNYYLDLVVKYADTVDCPPR